MKKAVNPNSRPDYQGPGTERQQRQRKLFRAMGTTKALPGWINQALKNLQDTGFTDVNLCFSAQQFINELRIADGILTERMAMLKEDNKRTHKATSREK